VRPILTKGGQGLENRRVVTNDQIGVFLNRELRHARRQVEGEHGRADLPRRIADLKTGRIPGLGIGSGHQTVDLLNQLE